MSANKMLKLKAGHDLSPKDLFVAGDRRIAKLADEGAQVSQFWQHSKLR